MSEWKVSPTEGVTNNNNGTFSFVANAPHKSYVITYTDDEGCKATYTYKLKTDCGGGGGDDPDPKPTDCVTPLDNVGQECDLTKTATQEFIDEGYACEGTHWWTGPLDGTNDEGFDADGDTSGDSIRCTASNLKFKIVDDWISYEIDTTTTGDFRKGVVRYTIAKNESSKPRHGILKVKTNENEHPDREFDGHSTSDYFCTTWCNIHFYQKGNGEAPVGDCSCDAHAEHSSSNHFSKDGSSTRVKVATVDIPSDCDCSFIDKTTIVPDTSTCSAGECSTFNILYDFDVVNGSTNQCIIKAKVHENNGGTGHNVQPGNFEKWHYKISSCSNTDYFNFYQDVGSVTPTTCEVTANSTLDGYVTKFNSSLGTTISTGNTPCTYSYLKEAYSAVSSKGSTTIMWMLANVLSELTPNVNKITKYFEVATSDSGGVLDLINSESVYNSRIDGGIEYAKWKHSNFEDKNEMAELARSELRGKGITTATLISVPSSFDRGDVINPVNIVPNMNGQTSLSQINQSDINAMSSILTTYPDSSSISSSSLGDNPFADKEYCSARLCQILGLSTTDANWLDFIDYAKDATDAAVNVIKRGISGVPAQQRLRPTGQSINGKTANMVCGGAAEEAARDLCDDTDTCKKEYDSYCGDTGSYPSGHSGRGFIAGLVYLQVKGVDKMSRMSQYCHNRAIVRAHWVSDTIAAKLITSTVIGFLNGVTQYLDKVNNLM